MENNMKAWQLTSPGRMEDVMRLVHDAAKPTMPLRAGTILIRVASAGINPAEYKLPSVGIAARAAVKFPNIPGMDLSGRVAAVGQGVDNVQVGDLVMARLDPLKGAGGLCDFVVCSHEEYAVLPPNVEDLDAAAGAPTAALTAYQSISPYVKADDKIFVNGGSGGVGTFCIQIGKALGCHVTVSCSTSKRALCEELGADEIIDYKKADVVDELKKKGQVFKLAVDNLGHSPPSLYELSKHFLLPEGTFVKIGAVPGLRDVAGVLRSMLWPSFLGGGKNKFVVCMTKNSYHDLNQIAKWMGEGTVKTIIDSTYEFEAAPKAYSHLKKGSSTGKVIVHVNQV